MTAPKAAALRAADHLVDPVGREIAMHLGSRREGWHIVDPMTVSEQELERLEAHRAARWRLGSRCSRGCIWATPGHGNLRSSGSRRSTAEVFRPRASRRSAWPRHADRARADRPRRTGACRATGWGCPCTGRFPTARRQGAGCPPIRLPPDGGTTSLRQPAPLARRGRCAAAGVDDISSLCPARGAKNSRGLRGATPQPPRPVERRLRRVTAP